MNDDIKAILLDLLIIIIVGFLFFGDYIMTGVIGVPGN